MAIAWRGLSFAVPLYFGLITIAYVQGQDAVIQDDARLHLVWLQQWIDPALFPNDPIADYYRAIAPLGFKALYWGAAKLGIAPLTLAAFLPTVLAVVTTGYLFGLTLQLVPQPGAAFLSVLLLNQNIWLKDDLVSASPRAFVYPLFAAFLYYLARRSPLCLVCVALLGVFYPQVMLVSVGILSLRLVVWKGRSLRLSGDPWNWRIWVAGLLCAGATILLYKLTVSADVGAIATAAQMQAMPEFGAAGRRTYFGVEPLQFWFAGASGLRLPLFPPIILVGLSWAILGGAKRSPKSPNCLSPEPFRKPFSPDLSTTLNPDLSLLAQVVLASLGLFLLAHLLFPTLYLPSRYTFYSLRVVLAIASGIVLAMVCGWSWRWFTTHTPLNLRQKFIAGVGILFAIAVVVVPAIPPLFLSCHSWVIGAHPSLYQFLANQPKSIRIASLSPEADNLPAFAQRSVLTGQEFALAYHPRFYQVIQQRTADLIRAQYSPHRNDLTTIIQRDSIDFWLLDRPFANPHYLQNQDWLIHSSFQATTQAAIAQLQAGTRPAIAQSLNNCTAWADEELLLLDAKCVLADESI